MDQNNEIVTIDGKQYEVPKAVATYVRHKQKMEQRALKYNLTVASANLSPIDALRSVIIDIGEQQRRTMMLVSGFEQFISNFGKEQDDEANRLEQARKDESGQAPGGGSDH